MFNWFVKKDPELQQSETTRAMHAEETTTKAKEFKPKRVSKPVDALLRGDRSLGLSVPSKTIRVFISSTFTDFQPERDRAMEVVYPKLRASAKAQFGLTFDIVDMRWGVLDVSTDNHATAELCLQELEACFEDSAGPAMVCLAGDRYGYRPAPVVIKAKEFEEVLAQIKPDERSFYNIKNDKPSDMHYRLSDKELLTAAYALNENAVPAEYVLQPISFFYPGFKRTRVEVKAANDRFWHVETRIRKVLQQASGRSKKLTEEEKRKYIISVTEDEVMTGLRLQEKFRKKDPNAPSKIIVYSRTFENLDVETEETKPKFSKFNDVCKDPEAEELLRSMQKRLVAAVPKSKSTQFALKAPWKQDTPDGNGFGPYNDTTPEGKTYIDKFCEEYYDILWKLIQDHVKHNMSKRQYPAADAGVVEEVLLHRDIMDENYKNFAGRANDLENFKNFVSWENRTIAYEETGEVAPCGRIGTLNGRSGTGKTALVSAGIAQIASEHPNLVIVYRFVGTTSRSGSVRDLLVSICLQIIRVYRDEKALGAELKERISQIKIKLESTTPYTFAELSEYFFDCLTLAHATNRPLLLIIDNPDGLSAADDPLGFSWLPATAEEIPADVKILLVMDPYLEGHDRLVYSKYQDYRGDSVDSLSIEDLSNDDVGLVVEKYLSGLWLSSTKRAPARKLRPEQRYELFQHCNKTPRPLYIRMAIDIARRVTSSTDRNETDTLLKDTMPDMINALFESLERSHGKMFVSHALAAITAAEYGLSWTELEDLISCDDFVLNQVYEWWTPSVRRIPPLLWIRVRNALVPFLTEKGVDGVEVYSWYNKEFEVVARARYLCQPAPKGITKAVCIADDDGDDVYTGTTRGEVTWFAGGAPTAKRNLEHSGDINALARMEVGGETWIISGSVDYTVRLWNPRSGKVISLFHYAPEEEGVDPTLVAVTAVGWAISAANESLIFSGTCMGHLYVWNFADVVDGSESNEAMQVIDVGASEEADEDGFKPIESICLTGTGKGMCAVTHQGTLCRVDLYPNEPGAGLAYKICPSGLVRPFASGMCPARDWEEAVFIGTIDYVLKYDFEIGELTGVLGGSPWATFVNPEQTEAPGEEYDEWEEAGALEAATHGRVRALKLVADGRLCVVFSNPTIAFIDLAAKTATWYDGAFEGAKFESADIAWGGDFIVAGYDIPAVDKSGVILTIFADDGETKFLEMEATSQTLEQTDNAIADLFIGKWANEPKPIDAPFNSKGDMGKSRDTTPKPRFVEHHGPFRDEQKNFPDLRHITNAPKHLIRAGRLEEAAAILIDK
ncbi:hypothetical protein BJ742DRAFT_307160 [Cladochytrium replicatum]|nr:hypothetical protein BJ742DRAFT_307160 [Cladochytrium replicatum]